MVIVNGHKIVLDDIEKIAVKTYSIARTLEIEHPETGDDAKFNMAFGIAVALVRGELLTTEELQARVARLDHEVAAYLNTALGGLPPDTQARALVTMIVADYGSWTPTMPIPIRRDTPQSAR